LSTGIYTILCAEDQPEVDVSVAMSGISVPAGAEIQAMSDDQISGKCGVMFVLCRTVKAVWSSGFHCG
jgi:hypothetical protein